MEKNFNGFDSIYNTSMKTQMINQNELGVIYKSIGRGSEGRVYKYDKQNAIKIFSYLYGIDPKLLKQKFSKLELLSKIEDKSFTFPKELIGFENYKKSGYKMDLIKVQNSQYKSIYYLKGTKIQEIEALLDGNAAIKRIHDKGIIIGDLRADNILIDENLKPKFVDTDNYLIDDYNFEIKPKIMNLYKKIYNTECSLIDNDKFLYAIIVISHIVPNLLEYELYNPYFMNELIDNLNLCSHSKDILKHIFSDSNNKPYIGEMLKEIDIENDEPFIEHKLVLKIKNKYFL